VADGISYRLNIARVVLLVGAGSCVASLALAQTLDEERQALGNAKAQSAAASDRARVLDDKASKELTVATRARAQEAAVAARVQAAESNIAAAQARIQIIERLRAEQRARLATKQEPAVRLLAALQMMARRPPALALVQPGRISDLVHVRAMLATLLPAVRARTEGLRADVEAGKRLRIQADQALAILAESQKRLESERAVLAQLAAAHRQNSERFAGSAMVEQDRAIAMGEKARDIVDLMASISADGQIRETLAQLPGPVLRPASPATAQTNASAYASSAPQRFSYRLPVIGEVVTGLGEISGSGVRARGLTIATLAGAQVVAPASGRIAFAGPYRGFGQIAIIDHGAGWTSVITSLSRLDVRVGDSVDQGSPLGRAGPDRPTVTVELRHGNQPVDIPALIG
jgi:murein hydrolase activator